MGQIKRIGFLLFSTAIISNTVFASDCRKATTGKTSLASSPLVQELNAKLNDPSYKVIVLGRHGKASPENKFTADQRRADPSLVPLDIARPLAKKGKRAADRLAELIATLDFKNVGMWGSFAKRVKSTAKPSREVLGDRVKVWSFESELYYADVPLEMEKRLATDVGETLPHAFFWGHGKSTLALFKKLTGASDGFLPTSAVMIVAVKASSWADVFSGISNEVEAFVWSPNSSHRVDGSDAPVMQLESSFSGLESMRAESASSGLESVMFESALESSFSLDNLDIPDNAPREQLRRFEIIRRDP